MGSTRNRRIRSLKTGRVRRAEAPTTTTPARPSPPSGSRDAHLFPAVSGDNVTHGAAVRGTRQRPAPGAGAANPRQHRSLRHLAGDEPPAGDKHEATPPPGRILMTPGLSLQSPAPRVATHPAFPEGGHVARRRGAGVGEGTGKACRRPIRRPSAGARRC